MSDAPRPRVMIAGIGGASLGTELLKCLDLARRYDVFGCDISPLAFGLYESRFGRTFLIDRNNYVSSVIDACNQVDATWLIPGGEQPTVLLAAASDVLKAAGVTLLVNDPDVVRVCSDKAATFERLAALGISAPRTTTSSLESDLSEIGMPCIVKPATGSGGSVMVFFATDVQEARIYADYIRRSGGCPLAQEYISPEDGEFTVGVLSLPDATIVGSIALRRSLDAKLSVMSRGRGGLISSGYSQGYIGDFPEIRARAEVIAAALGSRGALNVQGRMRDGDFVPFEINPRFSASTYLRALAGFNEVDILLQRLAFGTSACPSPLREGWYLRSLTEQFVAPAEVLQ